MLIASAAAGLAWQNTYRTPLKLELKIPRQRPYLTLTPESAARAKARVAQSGWAKEILDRTLKDADGFAAKAWGTLPPKGDDEHSAIGRRIFSVALAYALTGERKYAEWARDGLAAYAAVYPSMPLSNYRIKVFLPRHGPLFEAMWMVLLAQAYDMVADSGVFSPEQKTRV